MTKGVGNIVVRKCDLEQSSAIFHLEPSRISVNDSDPIQAKIERGLKKGKNGMERE